jgi:NADH dehydrogenase
VLVLAAGAQPNFFDTPGAAENSLPLYSVAGAVRLREHTLDLLDAVSRDRSYLDKGALNFVVVGAGPTGVETAGALSELVRNIIPHFYHDVPCELAQVHLVDRGQVVLNGFSDRAHAYARSRLEEDGVQIHLGVGVAEIGSGHVRLADGTVLKTRTVVWGGGEMAAPLLDAAGLAQGRGGRIDVNPDLTVPGVDGVYVLGDAANIVGPDGKSFPQLGSVAQQSGGWAAENILADLAGRPRRSFRYWDKGIMAMIGRNAAVAELGGHRHEIDGPLGFAAWLGVHAMLLSGIREKTDAFMKWGWEYVNNSRPDSLIESRSRVAIDWDDDDHPESDEAPKLSDP